MAITGMLMRKDRDVQAEEIRWKHSGGSDHWIEIDLPEGVTPDIRISVPDIGFAPSVYDVPVVRAVDDDAACTLRIDLSQYSRSLSVNMRGVGLNNARAFMRTDGTPARVGITFDEQLDRLEAAIDRFKGSTL